MSIRKGKQSGFTIVELLIVIIVIGILAALVITTLYSMLEAYYAQNGGYPAFVDFNTSTWRTTNMKGLDPAATCDPSASSTQNCALVTTPAAKSYAYQTWQSDGVTACTATTGQTCPKYTLTATLECTINLCYKRGRGGIGRLWWPKTIVEIKLA